VAVGIGVGVFLLVAGAILTWGVDLDYEGVDDQAVGAILLGAGVLLLVTSAVVNAARSHGEGDAEAGLMVFGLGAVMAFALEVDVPYIWDYALGIILMFGGAAAVVAAIAMERQKTRSRRTIVHRDPDRR
jgi:hypothetical protein